MGNICCKDDMHLTHRTLKPTTVQQRRVSVHTQPNIPTSTMNLPSHLFKPDLSNSSLYLSCMTRKDASYNLSNSAEDKENGRNTKSPISGLTPYYSNGYTAYPVCPDDLTVLKAIENNNHRDLRENDIIMSHRKEHGAAYTFGDVSTEGNHRSRKFGSNDNLSLNDSGDEEEFFEAHSFLGDDKENAGLMGLLERGSVLSQKTGSFKNLSDHVQSNQKVSNHVQWADEIEEIAAGVEAANNEGFEEYKKVYEAERAVHGLKIYMKNGTEDGDIGRSWSIVKAEWKMRCDAEGFITYVNTFDGVSETIKDAQIVEQCETFEDMEDNVFAVYYISSERGAENNKDCVFVRSYRQLGDGRWCDVFKSIECKMHPEYEGKKRFYIKSGGHMASREREGCRVRLYIEAVLGKEGEQSVPVDWVVEEIRHYVEKCCLNLN